MEKILNEYKLHHLDNTKYVVADNEAKMISAFREDCIRIKCSDHYLNRQLKHAFESAQIHISKSIIEYIMRSESIAENPIKYWRCRYRRYV